jgi:hypothetical protein
MRNFNPESASVFAKGVKTLFSEQLGESPFAAQAMGKIESIIAKGEEEIFINKKLLVRCARLVRNELVKSFSPFINIFDDSSFNLAESKDRYLEFVCNEGNKLMALINWCHFWGLPRPEWKVVGK